MFEATFGWADYLVLVLLQIGLVAVGIYFGRKKNTSNAFEDYILASRNVGVFPASASLVATFFSGIAMAGLIGEMYNFGIGIFFVGIGHSVAFIVGAFAVVPIFHRMPYVSLYEYLERRFAKSFRLFFALVFLIQQTFYTGLVIYIPAVSLTTFTPLPYWVALIMFGGICILYSCVGGMKAVIWTDVIQGFLMLVSIVIVITEGIIDLGGVDNLWEITLRNPDVIKINFIEGHGVRHTIWSSLVGGFMVAFIPICAGQHIIQRVLSVSNKQQAKRAMLTSSLLVTVYFVLISLASLVVFAKYHNCDPIMNYKMTGVTTQDQMMVYDIANSLTKYPGLAGLAVSGLFCSSLSTMSSMINSMAAVIVYDLLIPNITRHKLKEDQALIFCKIATISSGVICITMAFLVPFLGSAFELLLTIIGMIGGPLAGISALGMIKKKVSLKALIISVLTSTSLVAWIAIGSKVTGASKLHHKIQHSLDDCPEILTSNNLDNHLFNNTAAYGTILPTEDIFILYTIPYPWYAPIGFCLTISLGAALSCFLKDSTETDHNLLSPWTTHKQKQKKIESGVNENLLCNNVQTFGQDNLILQLK